MNQNNLITIASFTPRSLQSPNAWVGHLPFAAWVIQEVSPKIFVELGTHSGNSYFSFCQSVIEAGISTKCYAVDTWQGDEHAGQYNNEIFAEVNAHNQKHYAGFSRLLRMNFDDAITYFADESIELLHIDGLHTYEAVHHDFETWLPKLAPGAVVMFHDTNVRESNFGVHKLWGVLQARYPNNLEFLHSHGLGVLQLNNAPDNKKLEWLQPSASEKQRLINYFAALGSRELERFELSELKQHAAYLNQTVAERNAQVGNLKNELKQHAAYLNQTVAEQDARINAMLTSRSWQLTRPLRYFARLIRELKGTSIHESDLLRIRTTKLFKFRDALSKAMPQPVKRILRKLIGMVKQTQFVKSIVPKLNVLGNFGSIAADRKTVLVVSHEGSRTGAPILSYNLVKVLLKKYNVVALFLGPGPMLDACHASGAIVIGPAIIQGSLLRSDLGIKQITDAVQIEFALVNSIESRHVLPELAKYCVPTVSLIHEFAAYTRPRKAFYDAVFWSGQAVFSTRITRDNMVAEYPDLGARAYPVIPQGRCILPKESACREYKTAGEINRIQQVMRPEGFAVEGIVVLGAGFVQLRKGVDLFVECADRILRKAPDLPLRFIWVGKGYDPEGDVLYSAYLADQIRRAGLEKHVHFMDEVVSLEAVYAAADILLLSSRLDPLPNVAIDTLASGLPVVCFDKTTGIADILSEHGLGDICVAAYLDTEDIACKVLALAQSKELRVQIGERSAKIASETFDMAKYVTQIEQLALKQVDRYRQTELDIDTIAKTNLLRLDYYCPPYLQHQSRDEAIRWYVRSWASGVEQRKLFPGFHPGIYLEQHGVGTAGADPLADYLRGGQPRGPWNFELITAADEVKPLPPKLRIGLHIHAYYPDLFPEILQRLRQNHVRPDLLISVTSESARMAVAAHLETYKGGAVDIRVVPNRGRDIGPFLTEFGETIQQKYDLIGHLHTKKSADLKDEATGRNWYQFLLENLLGGQAPMADIILSRMADDQDVMMVFPDDPYIVGWGNNLSFAKGLLSDLGIKNSYRELCFPVGTMFWARPNGLKTLFDLNLRWEDYPEEPLPYDGSLLHALERLFGILAIYSGGSILLTNVPGRSR